MPRKFPPPLKMASELPLLADLQALVASYAAHSPTPSAAAIRTYLDAHPWINDVVAAYPEKHPGKIILGAPFMGLGDCWKCDTCSYARLYRIRRRYEPDENPVGTFVCDVDYAWA